MLHTALHYYIPLLPISSLFQRFDDIVDLSPRATIEAVAFREEVFNERRVNTIAIQEHYHREALWIVQSLLLKDRVPDCLRPPERFANKVLQNDKVFSFFVGSLEIVIIRQQSI